MNSSAGKPGGIASGDTESQQSAGATAGFPMCAVPPLLDGRAKPGHGVEKEGVELDRAHEAQGQVNAKTPWPPSEAAIQERALERLSGPHSPVSRRTR